MKDKQNFKKRIRRKSKKINIIVTIRIILILVILVCLSMIIYRYFNLKKADKIVDSINSEITINDKNIQINGATANLIDIDISSLKSKNSDTVGYLNLNGTNIHYPVVQSKDNSYYLTHCFDKTYNQSGWIFVDYRNNIQNLDKNTIIYGHNMLNNTMFSNLTKMLDKDFFNDDNNKYINLTTENKSTLWKIFSVYVTTPDTYYMTISFSSNNEYSKFLENLKNKSNFNFNENLNSNDKILTLSTCTNLNTKRLVVHAKLIYEEVK